MELRLEAHVIEGSTGHWCGRCKHWSLERDVLLVVDADTLHTWHRQVVEHCAHCDDG